MVVHLSGNFMSGLIGSTPELNKIQYYVREEHSLFLLKIKSTSVEDTGLFDG